MSRRSAPTVLLTDAERERLCAEGFVTVGRAAEDLGYSARYVRRLCERGAIYHRRSRMPDATRDSIRIPIVALREFKMRGLVPLRDQVVSPIKRAFA